MKAIARAQQRMASDERMRHFKEENAKLRARVATTMSKISPELRRRTTDMLRQRRDPKYRALFEAWDLDATTGDEVLSVIRERDNRIQEALYRYLEADGNSRDYVDGKNREASARILDLVGDEHYAELAQFESETTEAERAENKEKIRKFAKPPPPAIKL